MTQALDSYFEKQPDIVDPNAIVSLFSLQISYAPWPFDEELRIEFAEGLYRVLFEIITSSKLPVGHLEYLRPKEGHDPWVLIKYNWPGRSFTVRFDDTKCLVACSAIQLKNLVFLAKTVFSKLTQHLYAEPLGPAARLADRTDSISYAFTDRLRIGDHKVQGRPVKNFEIVGGALSLNKAAKGGAQLNVEDALLAVGVEDYIRVDFTQLAIKTLRNRRFVTGLSMEAPFNEEQTLLDITSNIKMDEEMELSFDDALDWEIPLIDFYRDVVLRRFYSNLLCSVEYVRVPNMS